MNAHKYSYLFLLLAFIGMTGSSAQKLQKIKGIAKEHKSPAFYEEQSSLWKKKLESDPKNAEAWQQYYKAERARLQLVEPELWHDQPEVFYQRLSPILDQAKRHIENSYDYLYMLGLNTTASKATHFFEKAYQLDPERHEVYGWLFVNYIPQFKEDKLTELAARMLHSNIYSNASLLWNYNALISTDQNSVIISNGDMDGIPKWVLQYGSNVRPDVLVINKWLLAQNADYRNQVYQQLAISLPTNISAIEISDFADFLAADILIRSHRPAYISSGTPKQFFRHFGIEDQMYLVGNVLKYSKQAFDNTTALQKNIEEKYSLEYLLNNFQQHEEDEIVKTQMNLTYLPGLFHLKKYYDTKKQHDRTDYCKRLIEKIAEDSGRKEEVLNWFSE